MACASKEIVMGKHIGNKVITIPASIYETAMDAIELSGILVKEWLETCMFNGQENRAKVELIVSTLNEHDSSKLHGRHFDIEFCKEIGLKILEMEEQSELRDAILSVHHSFIASFSSGPMTKIIESSNNKTWIAYNKQ